MLLSYLRYVARRKNEYGIHSPFVYKLYTQVIKSHQLEKLRELGIENEVTLVDEQVPEKDDKVMYVVEGIHENKKKEAFWDTICSHPDVTLTIDLYDKGFVFYREGMEKQNFVLRR